MRKLRPAALGILACLVLTCPAAADGETSVDTTGSWNGATVGGFGVPDIATFGQTVTVPAKDTVLDSFTFYFTPASDERTITLVGEVYAWDGVKATGPSLWESAPRTVDFPSNAFKEVTFQTGGVALVPGEQYVLFASVSKNYEQNPVRISWGFLYQVDAYASGGFVSLNDVGDESRWTTDPWFVYPRSIDLAFKALFSQTRPTSEDQCKNGGWRDFGVFKNQGDCVSFVATGGKNQPAGH